MLAHHYLKAIKLGYKYGYETISWIYMNDLDDERNAFKYLEKAVENGCVSCYATLGFHYSYIDFDRAKQNYELYMKYTPKRELSLDTMSTYLFFCVMEMSIHENIDEIKYLSKILPYERGILRRIKTNNFRSLNYEYKIFYDLPSLIQKGIEKKSKEHSYLSYILSSYSVKYSVEKNNFIDYIQIIFKSGFIPLDNFEGIICNIEVEEISKVGIN